MTKIFDKVRKWYVTIMFNGLYPFVKVLLDLPSSSACAFRGGYRF